MRLLAGRYRLVEQVGQGGTAVVWRAVDELLHRRVAVKMLAPRLAHDRPSRALIRAEAQIAAQLNHPHVANVYDYGEARAGGSRRVPYLVLEFVDGETLTSRLHRRGAMDWPEAVRVCADVAAALAATHAAGLVHRDVKPGNVLLSRSGVKLVDLGIALAVGAESANSRGEVRGTPSYMAPEQLQGGAAVSASDVYALGLVLYACLTGRSLRRTDGTGPEPVQPEVDVRVLGDAPEEIRELCRRCLAPEPADRPTSAEAALLLARAGGIPAASVPLAIAGATVTTGSTTVTVPAGSTAVVPAWAGTRRRPFRRGVLLAALPAVAAAAVLGAQLPGLTSTDGAAEGAGGNASPAPPIGCLAHYASRRAADGTFSADLTIRLTRIGDGGAARPVLSFTLPAGQRLTGAGRNGQPRQAGRRVTLPLPGSAADGRPVTLALRGTYDTAVPAVADGFAVDDVPCERASASVILTPPVSVTKDGGTPSTGDDRRPRSAADDAPGSPAQNGRRGAAPTTRLSGAAPSPRGSSPASAAPAPSAAAPSSPAPTTSAAGPSPSADPEPSGTGDVSSSPDAGPSPSGSATPAA